MERQAQPKDPGDTALLLARGCSHADLSELLAEVARLQLIAFNCGADGKCQQELALHLNPEATPILHLLHNFVAEIPLERRIEFLSSYRRRDS
ncbi:hypothetical protein H6G00_00370 [Leptolyngbya sp. FACHB-541]|uniref:hypothetical protein n=1 Tax=Leptolyngbya sp. FACHB-541 TaxID=2692810 RepID=UPI0016877B3D|nr:hypothetical protein [Leptolyngbya sp. FACHB-541]MBD1995083.1 hypothetical protein [Leptolyngbya sp. FACHB-541]